MFIQTIVEPTNLISANIILCPVQYSPGKEEADDVGHETRPVGGDGRSQGPDIAHDGDCKREDEDAHDDGKDPVRQREEPGRIPWVPCRRLVFVVLLDGTI